MTDNLAMPDFTRYRFHFRRLWWVPILSALIFALLAGGASVYSGEQISSSAVIVPTEFRPELDLYIPLTRFETSVEALQSEDTRDAIEAQLGYAPQVSIDGAQPSGAVIITANGTNAQRAEETRDAYLSVFLASREQAVAESIQRAAEDLEQQVSALQSALDQIDSEVSTRPGDAAAILAAADRAQTNALMLEMSGKLQALRAIDARDRLDAQVEASSPTAGRAVSSGGLLLGIGGFIAGLFLGILIVGARAYLDERLRTRSDVASLGLPTFGVIDLSTPNADAASLELAAAIHHHALSAGVPDYNVGLLAYEEAQHETVRRLLNNAADALHIALPAIVTAHTPAERIRVANASTAIVILVSPGQARLSDMHNDAKIYHESGAELLGVSLVAKDARSARQSG